MKTNASNSIAKIHALKKIRAKKAEAKMFLSRRAKDGAKSVLDSKADKLTKYSIWRKQKEKISFRKILMRSISYNQFAEFRINYQDLLARQRSIEQELGAAKEFYDESLTSYETAVSVYCKAIAAEEKFLDLCQTERQANIAFELQAEEQESEDLIVSGNKPVSWQLH